jgi:hypothetical protein
MHSYYGINRCYPVVLLLPVLFLPFFLTAPCLWYDEIARFFNGKYFYVKKSVNIFVKLKILITLLSFSLIN